jgi:tRNA threonylcarbamoyladenosine biosynthesis protein TsaE
MKKRDIFVTSSANQTRKLGEVLAKGLNGGQIICLTGELGSGKTTFAQGILRGLGAKGPYTSPTFVVMKQYKIKNQKSKIKITNQKLKIGNVYHIDAYRVGAQDILVLGWKEIVTGKNNVVIVEWAEKIKNIIPKGAVWVKFEYIKDNNRKVIFNSKIKNKNAK